MARSAAQREYDRGHLEGRAAGRQDALDILQRKYLSDDSRPPRNTIEAQALLDLAGDLAKEIRALP